MNKNEFLPIILGSDENAYGNVRLLVGEYGVRPLLICTRRLTATLDSSLFDIRCVEGFDSEAVFPDALYSILSEKKKEFDKLIVVACSDYYAAMMSKYYDRFEGLIENKFISPELLSTLDTKERFYALCEKYGLDYPKTLVVEPDARERALDGVDISFPIVVKPDNSNSYEYLHCSFEGKKKVFFFGDIEEYKTMVRNMNRSENGYGGKLIVQEFIPGGDDAMRVMNCYSSGDGKVRLMCLGQPVLEEYSPKTLGNYAAIITRQDNALYAKMKKFLEDIGYVGFSNFDMKYDRRSGKYMLFEINPRPGRSSFFTSAAGLNIMKELVDDTVYKIPRETPLLGSKTAIWSAVPKGVLKKYVRDPALRRECMELWNRGVARTLFCKEDMSTRRAVRIYRYYLGYYKSFKRYYFEKGDTPGGEKR